MEQRWAVHKLRVLTPTLVVKMVLVLGAFAEARFELHGWTRELSVVGSGVRLAERALQRGDEVP